MSAFIYVDCKLFCQMFADKLFYLYKLKNIICMVFYDKPARLQSLYYDEVFNGNFAICLSAFYQMTGDLT